MCFCGWVGVDTKVSRSAKPSIVAASIGAAQNRPPTDQPNFGSASSIVRLRTRMGRLYIWYSGSILASCLIPYLFGRCSCALPSLAYGPRTRLVSLALLARSLSLSVSRLQSLPFQLACFRRHSALVRWPSSPASLISRPLHSCASRVRLSGRRARSPRNLSRSSSRSPSRSPSPALDQLPLEPPDVKSGSYSNSGSCVGLRASSRSIMQTAI